MFPWFLRDVRPATKPSTVYTATEPGRARSQVLYVRTDWRKLEGDEIAPRIWWKYNRLTPSGIPNDHV